MPLLFYSPHGQKPMEGMGTEDNTGWTAFKNAALGCTQPGIIGNEESQTKEPAKHVYPYHLSCPAPGRLARPRCNLRRLSVTMIPIGTMSRPNRMGTTICRVDCVEGLRIHVAGLDAIEGTPVRMAICERG
jgi:hypothetical protein